MSDLHCPKCSEPWDSAEVLPAAQGDNTCALTPSEAKKFLAGKGCPSCRWGKGRKIPCAACDGWGKGRSHGYPVVAVLCEYCKGTGEHNPDAPAWKELHEWTRRELNLQPGMVGY